METRGNIIIIEGPQGVGKSTMANFLRDNLAASNLYRLTGINDKSISGLEKTKRMYLNLIEYMRQLEETELNLIFDRTFFTEQVYSNLGYKEYKFDETYDILVKKLSELDFNIYFVVLYLKNPEIYRERLQRDHHAYQAFSVENSMNQQLEYLELCDAIKYSEINKMQISTDDFGEAYKTLIKSIPILEKSGIRYK